MTLLLFHSFKTSRSFIVPKVFRNKSSAEEENDCDFSTRVIMMLIQQQKTKRPVKLKKTRGDMKKKLNIIFIIENER